MNLYTLNVIQPDKMSLWKYIKESEKIGNLFIFSSIWQWLKFPIFALFLMCLFCSIFIFVFGTIEEISSEEEVNAFRNAKPLEKFYINEVSLYE